MGFLDYITGDHLHIGSGIEKGLGQLVNMTMSVVGFYVFSSAVIEKNMDVVRQFFQSIPFDPSILTSMLLDITMGGYSMAKVIAASPEMAFFSGVLVASGIGCLISFQIPIIFTCIKHNDMGYIIKGITAGIITLPFGLFLGGCLCGLQVSSLLFNMIPIFLLCLLLVMGIMRAPNVLEKILSVVGSVLRAVAHGLTVLVFLRLFFPVLENWIPIDRTLESLNMTVRMTIGMAGGMVLIEGSIHYGRRQLHAMADWIGVNNYSLAGFIVSLVSPLAMFPIFHKMDIKGKLLNAAFSVMGAYILGAQMSFVTQVTTASNLYIYMLTKIICGALAMIFINVMHKRGKM